VVGENFPSLICMSRHLNISHHQFKVERYEKMEQNYVDFTFEFVFLYDSNSIEVSKKE